MDGRPIFAQYRNMGTRASISQDYWGDIKEDWGLGDGSPPEGYRGRAPVGGLGDDVPQKLKIFFVKLHIIFALKYNKQQLLLLLKNKPPNIGRTLPWTSPFINIGGGHVPPCPIGIDAPAWARK